MHISLRYIYGIGPTTALKICEQAKVDAHVRLDSIDEQSLERIRQIVSE